MGIVQTQHFPLSTGNERSSSCFRSPDKKASCQTHDSDDVKKEAFSLQLNPPCPQHAIWPPFKIVPMMRYHTAIAALTSSSSG